MVIALGKWVPGLWATEACIIESLSLSVLSEDPFAHLYEVEECNNNIEIEKRILLYRFLFFSTPPKRNDKIRSYHNSQGQMKETDTGWKFKLNKSQYCRFLNVLLPTMILPLL